MTTYALIKRLEYMLGYIQNQKDRDLIREAIERIKELESGRDKKRVRGVRKPKP